MSIYHGPPTTSVSDETVLRWREQQRRRRMLEGMWDEDLKRHLEREYGPARVRSLGRRDTTKNLARSTVSQLATLYDDPPIVHHADAAAVDRMVAIITEAGLWQKAQHLAMLTVGCRECFLRLHVYGDPDAAALQVRVVPADLTEAFSHGDTPDVPYRVDEYRPREVDGKEIWTRDVVSIEGSVGAYRIEQLDGYDLSLAFDGVASGKAYPYADAGGAPVLPYVLYHALDTGRLWDTYRGIELFDGSLKVAGMWTQWGSVVKDAGWPQRVLLNGRLQGATVTADGDAYVTTAPNSVLMVESLTPGAGTPSIAQWSPGGDPESLGNAIRDYAADLASEFDLDPADIQRSHTSARSGYAISVTRDGRRKAQARFAPSFSRSDAQTLRVIAVLWNRHTGDTLPETGWSVEYAGIPLSMEERRLLADEHGMRAELGVTSKPALLAKLDGITVDQARNLLREYASDNAEFGGLNE